MDNNFAQLFQWWKTCLDGYVTDKHAQAIFGLITSNSSYTPDFWRQRDEHGLSPFHWAVKKHVSATELWKLCETWDANLISEVFNTPDANDQLILYDVWKNCQKSVSPPLLNATALATKYTSNGYWTWLDGPDQIAGSGWIQSILKLQEKNSTPVLNELSGTIIGVYPQNVGEPTKDSPWLKVTQRTQVETLLQAGFTLYDEVTINEWIAPAWKVMRLLRGTNSLGQKLIDTLHPEDQEELIKIGKQEEYWKQLAPQNHRAKIGYVRQVVDQKGVDPWGVTSLYYLMHNRSDLIALLHQELLYNSDDVLDHFLKKDAAGYSILTHSLINGRLPEIEAILKSTNRCVEFGVEGAGWFAHEQSSGAWFKKMSGSWYPNEYEEYFLSMKNLVALWNSKPDVEIFFGDAAQQAAWVAKWDELLPQIPSWKEKLSARSTNGHSDKISASQIVMLRQALLFLEKEEDFSKQLDPRLSAQLKTVGVWARTMPGVTESWHMRLEKTKLLRADQIDPPSSVTPGMIGFLNNKGVDQIFRSCSQPRLSELVTNWSNVFQRNILLENVGGLEEKTYQRRKM